MDASEDAYGQAIRDHYERDEGFCVVERDDGHVGIEGGPAMYFSEYEDWPATDQAAVDRAEGRVLDVGCGAGRHALYCQRQGHDVTGIDVSPGSLAVARDRGLDDARELDVADVRDLDATYDTVLMLGNNFGLVGTADTAPDRLRALADVTSDDARLLATSRDPTGTDDPAHLEYHDRNRERGRLPGALRMRIRYKRYATPYFDYLIVAPDTMRELLADTPWYQDEVVDGENGMYLADLRKR